MRVPGTSPGHLVFMVPAQDRGVIVSRLLFPLALTLRHLKLNKPKPMTLYQFNALRQDDQRTLVTEKGVFLAERQTSRIKVFLFGLNGFYVEILTDAET